MSNEVKIEFTIPNTEYKSIEFMSILAQAYALYSLDLTEDEIAADINWFRLFVESDLKRLSNN